MDALDSGTMNIKAMDGNIALQGTDKDLHIVFYAGTRINEFKSIQQGAPIYEPVDMIRVHHPGEPLNVPERPVNENDKRRFKLQWDMYKEGKDTKIEGTPLSVIFPGKPEIVKSLEVTHIHTVQQLARLSDTATQNMMFGFNLRQKAVEYLEVAEKGVQFHQFETERANLQQQIRELTEKVALLTVAAEKKVEPAQDNAAVAALTQLVTNLQAQMTRRPGRPRKIQQEI